MNEMNECIKIIIISVYKIITSCDALLAIMVVLVYLRACVIKLVSECLVPSIFFIIAHTYMKMYIIKITIINTLWVDGYIRGVARGSGLLRLKSFEPQREHGSGSKPGRSRYPI
jgi:hypothetical protein